MKRYSKERKAAMLVKLMSPENLSIIELSEQSGISRQTLYNWRKRTRNMEGIMSKKAKHSGGWSSADKFKAVLETASFNEVELSEYCRKKGLYPEQVKEWKNICINANSKQVKSNKADKERANADKKKIKGLERELNRKEKALAEAAALLVLKKKPKIFGGIQRTINTT